MKTCLAYGFCESFDLKKLFSAFDNKFTKTVYKDVTLIPYLGGDIVIFPFGVMVFWNLSVVHIDEFLHKIQKSMYREFQNPISDDFTYSKGSVFSFKQDHIVLESGSDLEKIAVSYCIAQSIKLSKFEDSIVQIIKNTEDIPKKIIRDGSIDLSSKEISKLKADLFVKKNNVNLQYELLDTPDFFWDYPELDTIYQITSKYLEISNRVIALNKKLEVIHELLEMLDDEQRHKYSSKLEWIIIFLIIIEIMLTLWEKFFVSMN